MIGYGKVSLQGLEKISVWHFGKGDLYRVVVDISDGKNDFGLVLTEIAFEELLLEINHFNRKYRPDYLDNLKKCRGGKCDSRKNKPISDRPRKNA